MTVVQPNSIAGINSITVQSGNSLAIHKSDGTLIREIVSSTGISTYSSISVGSAATDNNAGKSINIGLGASISQHADNSLSLGTNGDERFQIDSSGNVYIGGVGASATAGSLWFNDTSANASKIAQSNGNSALTFHTGSSQPERTRIDSSGRILVGVTATRSAGTTTAHLVQVEALDASSGFTATRCSANSGGPYLTLTKTRAASLGDDTVVQVNDSLGMIRFAGADGTDTMNVAASINASVDGTPGTDDMPGRLVFSTTADGANTATERLRITAAGNVDINGTPPWSVAGGDYRNLSISGQVANSGGFLWLGNGTATTNGDFDLGRINFCNGATITSQIAGTTQTSANDDGRISFHTKATGGSLIERLRIDSSGHLKIGTAAAAGGRLYFESTSGAAQYIASGGTNNQSLIIASSAGEFVHITSDGKVLLGTNSVSNAENFRIHTASSSKAIMKFTNNDTGTGSGSGLEFGLNSNEDAELVLKEDKNILFYTGNSPAERLRITSAGKSIFSEEIETPQDYPTIKPTLDLNFVATKTLDPRFEYYSYGPASYVDENGKVVFVTESTPRFDHDPVTRECKGLLIEGERINKIPHSFDNGNWSAGSAGTLTRNAGIAPDGTNTATKASTTSNDIDVSPQLGPVSPGATGQISISGNVTYTLSIWAKASTAAQIGNNFKVRWKRVQGNSVFAETTFALTGNWVRYSATATTASNNTTIACYIGGVSGSEALVWGAQLESGTTASSLIPTYGYTQSRGPDVLHITGEEFTDFYNQEEGTIFLSASYETDARSVANVTIDDISSYANYTEIGYRAGGASSGDASSYIRTTAGNDQYYKNWSSSATQGNEFKIALGYKDDNYASSANGSTVHTDTSGTTHKTYDRLKFSEVHTVGHGGVGYYRRLMYYSKKLTNSQLVTLTS